MLLDDQLKTRLSDFFKNVPEVQFGYIFGSQAKGAADSRSDLDIAIYGDTNVLTQNETLFLSDLSGQVAEMVNSNDVDIVLLNNCPLALAKDIIFEGEILFEKDLEKRIEWEILTTKKWWDWQPRLREWNRAFLHRLNEVSDT
jgi:predicted nucleotidyltransferase